MYTQTEGRRQDSAGYLGARYNPMFLTDKMMPDDLHRQDAITDVDHHDRAALRDFMAKRFIRDLNNPSVGSHENAYERVHGLMASDYLFDIEREPQAMRDHYGPTQFGQQCLIARRLVEAGVPSSKLLGRGGIAMDRTLKRTASCVPTWIIA